MKALLLILAFLAQTAHAAWWNGLASNSGTLTAVSDTVEADASQMPSMGIQVTGAGTGTIIPEVSLDGSAWLPVVVCRVGSATGVAEISANGIYVAPVAGMRKFRARRATGTGTWTISLLAAQGSPKIEPAADTTRDAFARFRVSQPVTLFDGNFNKGISDVFWSISTSAGAAITATAEAGNVFGPATMTVGVGGTAILQSKQFWTYQPGKSQLLLLTTNMQGGQAGTIKRLGYFQENNGTYLELSGTSGVSVVIRDRGTATSVSQSAWNIDKLDGTGPSGITARWDRAQILFWDLEWLGVGTVRFGLIIDGLPVVAHQFRHANSSTTTYMATANLPIRYELTSSTGAGFMYSICQSLSSEGGSDSKGREGVATRNGTPFAAISAGAVYPLVAIRAQAGLPWVGLQLQKVEVFSDTASDAEWGISLNPVGYTGGTWFNVTGTAAEMNIGATAAICVTCTGSLALDSGYIVTGAAPIPPVSSTDFLATGLDLHGNRDVIVLWVRKLDIAADNFYGKIRFKER